MGMEGLGRQTVYVLCCISIKQEPLVSGSSQTLGKVWSWCDPLCCPSFPGGSAWRDIRVPWEAYNSNYGVFGAEAKRQSGQTISSAALYKEEPQTVTS